MNANMTVSPGTGVLADTMAEVRRRLGDELQTLSVERAVLGLFFTGVKLNNGVGGICATPIKSIPQAVCCPTSAAAMPFPGKIRGRAAAAFLDDLSRPDSLRRTLAIAVLSALSATCMKKAAPDCEVIRGADAFDTLKLRPDAHVVVVGALVPVIRVLRARSQSFHILEKDPATLRPDEMKYFAPADAAPEIVPLADLLITTGTTLTNDTLDGLLLLAKKDAEVVVVGPTASLLPDAFFRRGVTVVGGVEVTDADQLLDVLAEGGSGHHFFGRSAERVVMRKLGPAGSPNIDHARAST